MSRRFGHRGTIALHQLQPIRHGDHLQYLPSLSVGAWFV